MAGHHPTNHGDFAWKTEDGVAKVTGHAKRRQPRTSRKASPVTVKTLDGEVVAVVGQKSMGRRRTPQSRVSD
jgi:hypothetical protein